MARFNTFWIARCAVLCLTTGGIISTALAAPVQWSSSVGGNDHWYEWVGESTNVDWTTARTHALARTYAGLPGYLATITSAAENSFVVALKPVSTDGAGEAWFGATDQTVEGEWRWADGPEAGQLLWLGGISGTAFGYTNWANAQPDNATGPGEPNGEDWANLLRDSSGKWNDRENSPTGGYIVEYSSLTPPVDVPEPATLALLALGLVGIGYSRRKRV